MLALDGSNWQHVDLFDFQTGIEVCGGDGDDLLTTTSHLPGSCDDAVISTLW